MISLCKPALGAALAGLLVAATTPASALERLLGSQIANLSHADRFDSHGKRLPDLSFAIQQDRANYHRFGNVLPWDWANRSRESLP